MKKLPQKHLKRVHPNWEEIFASFGDGLVILDTEKRLIGINPAAERLNGLSAESLLGHFLEEAFSDNQNILQRLKPSFDEGRTTTLREIPWCVRKKERAIIDLSATPLTGDNGELKGWVLVCRDITPMKNLEEEIRKADRLAMMGTIAAGLAHEIKNPLGGIKGAAQLLKREQLSSESSQCVDIVLKEVGRVDRLVNQLLTFSKPKNLTVDPVNLNELLDALLVLQKPPLEERGIRMIREFDPSLPPILGDGEQLQQVFLNFLKNAIEAIPEERKGEIRIRSRMMTDFKIKGEDGRKPSQMVLTEIHDNGIGISPKDREKIFTPFFTTKEKGYGLGLAMAQRIVQEHGGVIHVKSENGKGTIIQVLLRSLT